VILEFGRTIFFIMYGIQCTVRNNEMPYKLWGIYWGIETVSFSCWVGSNNNDIKDHQQALNSDCPRTEYIHRRVANSFQVTLGNIYVREQKAVLLLSARLPNSDALPPTVGLRPKRWQ
jgi:hypothetical protein